MKKVFYFDEEYFCKSYDSICEVDRLNLLQESEIYLKTHRKVGELHPPIMAEKFFTKKLLEKDCWKNLTKKVVSEVNEYCETYLKISPKFEACWINKVGFYTNDDIENRLYFDEDLQSYTDNHYHTHHKDQIISCIFYLQNPNKKYGTLVRTKNGSLVLDGTENSLSIFDPRLYHAAVIPSISDCIEYPRYVIVMTFTKKEGSMTPPA